MLIHPWQYWLLIVTSGIICLAQVPPYPEECVSGRYPPPERDKVPNYVINLDLSPTQRWNELAADKSEQIKHLLTTFKTFVRAWGNASEEVIQFIDSDLGYLAETFPAPFGDEMKGIGKASGIPLGEIVLYNIFYELFTVCTSIVAQDSSGKLYHARNLDFGLFMGWNIQNKTWKITEALRPTLVNLEFTRNGKTLYKSVNYAGYVGVITGIKPGVFTFSMDERFNINGGYIGVIEWLLGDRKAKWMSFLTREVMEFANSYEEAQRMLANTPMLAPSYFILGGNQSGQASVITRARSKAIDIWNMDVSKGMWYLLETNYDHWKSPFFLDDRRTPGKKCMNKLTQANVSFAGLFDVLSSRPVLNKLTTYTALMQVNDGTLETYLQYCPEPCFPW